MAVCGTWWDLELGSGRQPLWGVVVPWCFADCRRRLSTRHLTPWAIVHAPDHLFAARYVQMKAVVLVSNAIFSHEAANCLGRVELVTSRSVSKLRTIAWTQLSTQIMRSTFAGGCLRRGRVCGKYVGSSTRDGGASATERRPNNGGLLHHELSWWLGVVGSKPAKHFAPRHLVESWTGRIDRCRWPAFDCPCRAAASAARPRTAP